MQLVQGIAMLAFFAVVVVLIVRRISPIALLIVTAIVWALIAGAGGEVLTTVIQGGVDRFAPAIMAIALGAWFAQLVIQTGVAETLIRGAVELAGGRPLPVTALVSIVTGLLFTSVYGVGAAIAIGVIVLPIMISIGVPRGVATAAFVLPIGAGNYLNPVEFAIFDPLFGGLPYEGVYLRFYLIAFSVYVLFAIAMAAVALRGSGGRRRFASATPLAEPATKHRPPAIALIAPLLPVGLVALGWPVAPTMLFAIGYVLIASRATRGVKSTLDLFQKTLRDAFPDIALVAGLFLATGMLMQAGELPQVADALGAVFNPILPSTPLMAVLFFGLLAPLALYRGPFSIIGTGGALLAIFLSAGVLSPVFLYAVWRGPLTLQSSQDPTNSWVVWSKSYTQTTDAEFFRTALPWGWAMCLVNAGIAYALLPH